MIVISDKDLKGLREIGSICAYVLKTAGEALKEGISTAELDNLCGKIFAEEGALSAPKSSYDFPGHVCISVNDEVAHGIPGERILKKGDSVNIDVSASKNGFFADTGATFLLAPVKESRRKMLLCCQRCLNNAIAVARSGFPINGIGLAVQKEARRSGYKVIKNLCGHGVGHKLHEFPDGIQNYYDKKDTRVLAEGQVLAIEPFVSAGDEYVREERDGWTLKTPNHSFTAQFEHTVVVTKGEAIIITVC
jgi:methionyl aminopeptidase